MLGGQHSTWVLKERYDDAILGNTAASDIHSFDKECNTCVLKEGTSLQICKWASGFYQQKQRQVFATLFSEMVNGFLEKLSWMATLETKTPVLVTMTGDQIWDHIVEASLPYDLVTEGEEKKLNREKTV